MQFIKNILKNLVSKPATRNYPFQKRAPIAQSRGHLTNDIDRCIFCSICVKKCPSNALAVTRNPNTWTLDPYKCIVCGACVEACPKSCLIMKEEHGQY